MYGSVSRMLRIAHPLALALKHNNVDSFTSGAENYKGVDKLSQNVLYSEQKLIKNFNLYTNIHVYLFIKMYVIYQYEKNVLAQYPTDRWAPFFTEGVYAMSFKYM